MGTDPRADAVAATLILLREHLNVEEHNPSPDSHSVIVVGGLEDEGCVTALGVYLTGLVANVVASTLSLPTDFSVWGRRRRSSWRGIFMR